MTVRDIDVQEKRVLLRCDFNVPLSDEGIILDDFRIQEALPTIKYLVSEGAKVILLAHLGSPAGEVVDQLKMGVVKDLLEDLLDISIQKTDDCVGVLVRSAVEKLKSGEVLMLENVRFHKEEKENDQLFAKELSGFADLYVNDSFDVCHREHASVASVPKYLPHVMGLSLQKELVALDKVLYNPEKPLVVIVGGKKVETKAKFINSILGIADAVIVSGLIKKEINESGAELAFPQKIVSPTGELDALDINAESIDLFCEKIMTAKAIIWNGPMGQYEDSVHAKGTLAVANAIIKSGAFSVVGGGETIAFLHKEGILDKFSHVSTGGGAMLAYLSGEELPGLKALQQ